MFGAGPDQLSGYCQQVSTMLKSSADWVCLGPYFNTSPQPINPTKVRFVIRADSSRLESSKSHKTLKAAAFAPPATQVSVQR